MKKIFILMLLAGLTLPGICGDNDWVILHSTDTSIVQDRTYDPSTGTNQVTVDNQPQYHYTSTEHIMDTTNSGDGEEVYSSVINGETYQNFAIQLQGSADVGVTFKVFATLIEDATVPTQWDDAPSTDWYDCSTDVLGGASTTIDAGASEIYWIDTDFVFYRMIVQAVPDDATNTADVYVRKAY